MEVTHDCVDLETAKLLKDKGFDCKVSSYYSAPTEYKPELTINRVFDNKKLALVNWNREDDFPWLFYSAPEHWIVIKWLRVIHFIFIGIELIDNSRETCYQPTIWTMKDREYQDEDCMDQAKIICNWKEWKYSTPEEAELEAIKYCLNNLIDGK